MRGSAYRIAALAPLRRASLSERENCHSGNVWSVATERAQRCGSSDHAAAAEGVEDYGFQGGFGVDGDVAHAVPGTEALDRAAPLGQALAVQAYCVVI